MPATSTHSVFQQEAEDLLDQVESALLAVEAEPSDAEQLNRLFRLFHTIKGSAAMLGLDPISSFTHHVESTLDAVREGRLSLTPELVRLVLASKDYLAQLLVDPATQNTREGERLTAEFDALLAAGDPRVLTLTAADGPRIRTTYRIQFRPHPELLSSKLHLEGVLEGLRALGDCQVLELQTDEVSETGEPGRAWDVTLTTSQDEAAVRSVFMFAQHDCELQIDRGLMAFVTDPPQPAGASAEQRSAAVAPESAAAHRQLNMRSSTLRVPSERLDHLVTLVGELVINQSRLNQAYAQSGSHELTQPVEAMERLIAELRDSVLSIRMLPIGTTFNRFKRLVHDLSAELHKEVELVLQGEDTEVDKTVLDQLGDPLVHLIRNSLDHGIEAPQRRLSAGKPRRGQIVLSATHEGAHVLIDIRDDGRGIDREAVRAKAVQKGLIEAAAQLSDQDVLDLITHPGLSTAAGVTQVSGRGVGMDVVKRTIEELRGTLQLTSEAGRGSRVRITLPLTLAIIDGLLVEIAGDHFILPMAAVLENVELTPRERAARNGRNVIDVRGQLVPYVCLRRIFGWPSVQDSLEKVVVVSILGQRLGLVVDRVLGSHQTVIQPLGPCLQKVRLFSGTTILGDGRVALILDLSGALRHVEDSAELGLSHAAE